MKSMLMLLEWVLTSAALILVVAALRALLGKRVSAGLRYALWAVVLVRLLVPVQLFSLPVPAVLPEASRGEAVEVVRPSAEPAPGGMENVGQPALAVPTPNTGTAAPSTVPLPADPKAEPLSVWQVLGWVWLAGSMAMGLAFLISNTSFARRLRRARAAMEGVDCPLPVYTALNLPSPCLFGVLRPAVYVTPEAAADPAMLRHVLAHEYTHFRHGDHVWNVLRSAALAVHWWNPLVWLAVAASRRDCELACDEGALKRLGDGERIAYGRTLLALLTEKPRAANLLTCATTMTGGQKSVWERVTRIAHAPKRWLWAAVAMVLAAAVACVCAFGQAAEPEDNPNPVPTPAGGQEVVFEGEIQVDLNRNGVPETLRYGPVVDDEKQAREQVQVWEKGEMIWSDEAHDLHPGWKAVFLCTLDGEDYLLRYVPYAGQGWGDYGYQLFTLSEDGEEQVARENSVSFYVNDLPPVPDSFDAEEIAAFMDEINGLLSSSVQLINTDEFLLDSFEKAGRLYDGMAWLGWSDQDSLLDHLKSIQARLEGGWEPPLVRELDSETHELLLSYNGKEKRFTGDWDHYFDDETAEGELVDLDGDGRDEIAVILRTAHGTGCFLEELHLFDAETLDKYDCSDLTEQVISHINSTGDDQYFYFSAPGMETVAIPKSAAWAPAAHIQFGDYVDYMVESGQLYCSLGCDMGMLEYSGSLKIGLALSGGRFVPTSSEYTSGINLPAGSPAARAAERYEQVLLGNADFSLMEGQTSLGQMSVDALPGYFSVSDYSIIDCFAVVDLDGDGGKEVVLSVTDVAGDLGGNMVLYYDYSGGIVYGRPSDWKSFWSLKTDGTFAYSNPTGSHSGYGTFRPDTGEIVPFVYGEGPLGQDYDTYVVEGQRVTEADFFAYAAQQDAKPNVVWYDFTPENIKAVLQY